MKLKRIVLCLCLFAVFAVSFINASAGTKAKSKKISNSEKAQKILEKAGKTMTEMKGFSAKTENVTQSGRKMISTMYQRNNPDGTIFMRMETGGAKNPMTFISNNKGKWYIIGNTAIKMSYMTKMQADAMANVGQLPKIQNETKYSIKNGKINDIKCFVVTSKLSEEQIKATAEIAMKAIPEDMKKMMKKMNQPIDMAAKIPSTTKHYIGKKDYFIYSTENYNKNGNKISQMTYVDVKLNVEPDEKLFQIPENMEVKIAKTVMEFSEIMMQSQTSKRK